MAEPLVSLVTSAYRADKYLECYFQGMCAQTIFGQMEIILVLNDPTAEAGAIADGYAAQYPDQIRVVKVPRETIGASTNRGYRLGRGRYLCYADVDDAREPACYERQVVTLENSPGSDFTYGDFVMVRAYGEHDGNVIHTPDFDRALFTSGSYVGANHFFRRVLLERCGYWDEQFRSGGDFEFQVRAAFNCIFAKTSGLPLFYYTRSMNSTSASSSILQPIERTVVELRYGSYDKTMILNGYPYVRRARQYRLDQLRLNGAWQPIENYVPNYRATLAARAGDRAAFEQEYRRWLRKERVAGPLRSVRTSAKGYTRQLLSRLGLLERVRKMRTRSLGSA